MLGLKRHRRSRASWHTTPEVEPEKCRTPWKELLTKQHAKERAKILRKRGLFLYPYECACRWWHLTKNKQRTASDEITSGD